MRDLTPFLKDIPKVDPSEYNSLHDRLRQAEANLQSAKDAVQPDRAKQGPVFAGR